MTQPRAVRDIVQEWTGRGAVKALLPLLVLLTACPLLSRAATNSFVFTYADRTALLADGWSFVATTAAGGARNTETTTGAVVDYNQSVHPGAVRIPTDVGDLWGTANNTRNSLFHGLSSNWTSLRLEVAFAPTANYQQLQLALYQDDDNYVEVGHAYNSGAGGLVVAMTREDGGAQNTWSPLNLVTKSVTASTVRLRLDRDLATDRVVGLYSMDGTNWTTLGSVSHALNNPQICIWTGGSTGGLPNCDIRKVDVITSDVALGPILFAQPQHIVFNATAGQPCTNLQQLRLLARRTQTSVNYTITSDSAWLTNSALSGTTPGTCDVAVVNTTGLAPGIYQGNLTCAAPGAVSAVANVTLIVNPAGRTRVATWQGGRSGAMSVWVDGSNPTAYNVLSTNGLRGSYMLIGGTTVPAFAPGFAAAGMELGGNTVDALCFGLGEPALRYEIEYNLAMIAAQTVQSSNNSVSLAWPCGFSTPTEQAIAGDYVLAARGYNLNLLEDPTPYNPMSLKSFNAHGDTPAPPADFKTVVDAAVAQGKWFNMVLGVATNDDGAIAYSTGRDIWVAPAGTISKYILQRDRTVITNYSEATGQLSFGCYRLPLDGTMMRSFETAVGTQDTLTLRVDVTGIPAVTNLTINGAQTPYSTKVIAGRTNVLFSLPVTTTAQSVVLRVASAGSNQAPVLSVQTNRLVKELTTLMITNAAADADFPAQTLTYTLLNPPTGAQISTNGVITWTPSEAQGPGTYTLTTVVTDSGFPPMSATNSFQVTVNEVNAAPVLPAQVNRTLYQPGSASQPLVVNNAATDSDLPANTLTYQLLVSPPGAAIDNNGVITWDPSLAPVPSTNIFTTVVTDYNPQDTNAPHLSATNTFSVLVLPPRVPWLRQLPDVTINGGKLLVVTNTATEAATLLSASNTFTFAYSSRSELLGDGWSFAATLPDGTPRPTEITGAADYRVISYDQLAHPGEIWIPCDGGDLWGAANNSVNSLFRYLPPNWSSMTLDFGLAATLDFQQVHLMIYQDDDNYLQVGTAHNSTLNPTNGTVITMVWEKNGATDHIVVNSTPVTNLHIRMNHNPDNSVTGYYSLDGINWLVVGSVADQGFVNARLGIWCGGLQVPYAPGMATLDLRHLDLLLPTGVTSSLTYSLLNPPRGATIDTNGVIRWTPADPGTNVITTVVMDNAGSTTTNSFTVFVPTAAPPFFVFSPTNVVLNEGQSATVTNTATSARNVYPYGTNTYSFNYTNRAQLTNDGWNFLATTPAGASRNTESPNPAAASAVVYNPGNSGVLRIPCQVGDLWTTSNNSTNSLFHALPTNWLSARLNVNFSPTVNYQQAHLTLYQDDNNYVQVGMVYNTYSNPGNPLGATLDQEIGGVFSTVFTPLAASGNLYFRLDRNVTNNAVTGFYSMDGVSWTRVGTFAQAFANPRLAIWTGGGTASAMAPMDVRRLDVVVTNSGFVSLNYMLVNSPTNAAISADGVITWTPSEVQGPSTNVITTVVTDTGTPPGSASNSFTVVVNEINLPPVLSSQPNRTNAGLARMVVTNAASDPDYPANTLSYSLASGPANASIDTNGIITWTPTAAQVPSTNVFTTVVTDYNPWAVNSQHLSATNSFNVVVTTTHTGPALPLQTNLTVAELTPLVLTNTAIDSDAPVLALTYSFLAAPAGAAIDTNGVITWTPTEVQGPTTNVFITVVQDNGTPRLSATNTFTVVVNEINFPPVLPAQGDVALAATQSLVVTNGATDPDIPSNSLSYQLLAAPAGAAIDTNGVITWTPTYAQIPSTNTIITVVTDSNPWAVNSQHLSATNSFTVSVYPKRDGPILPAQTNRTVVELTTLTVTNVASDFDIPPPTLTYSLLNPPAGATIDTNGVISWTPTEAQGPGTNVLTTVVRDNGSPTLSATNSFSVVVQEVNLAPVLPPQSDQLLIGLQTLVVTNTATDADLPANPLSYQLVGAPTGAVVSADGVITWKPSIYQVPGTNVFTTIVTDSSPLAINAQHLSATNSFTVVVNATHDGPTLPTQPAVITAPEVVTLIITNTAIDTDVPPLGLNYTLVASPAGASIDGNGIITWTPTESQGPSTNTFTVLVFDNGTPMKSDLNNFTVVVNEMNVAPVLPPQANRVLVGQQALTVTNTATDSDWPPNSLAYQLLSGPEGATLDAGGVISWTPSVSQVPSTNVFTTVVTDSNPWAANAQHLSTTNSFTVVVNPIHNLPSLPVQTNLTIVELTSITVSNAATATNLPALSLSYSLLNSPAGAVIDTNGVITWTPTEAQGPATNLIVTVVTDSGNPPFSATNSFTVVVNELNVAPVLPVQGDRTLTAQQPLIVTNTATDADLPANSLSYQLAAAPGGATISSNGVISWTPSVMQVPSTNLFRTVVTDFNPWALNAQHLSATNSFTVVVNGTYNGPALPVQSNQTMLELTTLVVTNTAIDTDLPVPVLTYSLANAPTGVQIDTNGVITWTPSEAQGPGVYRVTTVVADAVRPTLRATNSFTVTVNEVNVAPSLPAQAPQVLAGQQMLLVTNTASDPDLPANDLSYSLVTAPAGAAISSNGVISWTPAVAQVPSTNLFTTVVTDSNPGAVNASHLSATNTFVVTVNATHIGPRLPASTNFGVNELATLTVTNTATDTDLPALSLTYSLVNPPTGVTITTNGIITWAPTEAQGPSTNVIVTVVTDSGSPALGDTNYLTVVVNEVNVAPVLPAQSNWVLLAQQALLVTNTASDADLPANALSYQLVGAPAGASINSNGVIAWTPSVDQVPGTYVLTTVATDSNPFAINAQHLSATNSFTVVVNAIHNGPALPAQSNLTVTELTPLTITNTAMDADVPLLGLTYSLVNPPAGVSIDTNGVITWTPSEAQGPSTNTIITVVRDGAAPPLSATNSFTVVVTELNSAPVLPLQTNVTLAGRQSLTITNTAVDSDIPANSLTYSLLQKPVGALIDGNGIISWTPVVSQVPSTNVFKTVVTDYNPSALNNQHLSTTNTFTVVVAPVHNGPVPPPQGDIVMDELTTLDIYNTASDTDLPALKLTYSLLSPPAGMVINPSNGQITWTPTEEQGPSTNVITAVVQDNGTPPLSATNSFTVVVNEINQAPVLPAQSDRTFLGLQTILITNAATDADLPANGLSYQLSTAPAGAVISANGIITWSPAVSQIPSTNLFTTIVTDSNPSAANEQHLSATNRFTVVCQAIHNGPALALQTNISVAELTVLTVTNTAIDNDSPPRSVNYQLAQSPAGAVIDTNGVITWAPTEGQGPSTNTFTTIVTDDGTPALSATNSFSVVVNEINVPPVLLPQPDHLLIMGLDTLLVTNTATDADVPANALTYQLIGAPAGASIDANGVISWSPAPEQVPSTNRFVTVATDSNPWAVNEQHLSVTNSFTVVCIYPIHNGPSLSPQSNVTVTELGTVMVTNTAVDSDIPALSVTYSLVGAPAGATIDPTNGVITWTPSEAQGPSTNIITTVATDNGVPSKSATNSFVVTVNEINVAPVLPAQTNWTLFGQQPLRVTNTATDVDLPVNQLTYQLVSPPSGAAIDTNGVITWIPSSAQVPSTNTFTTVVTDENPWAINAQHLSATNSFSVVVNAIHNGPVLPSQEDLVVTEQTALTVTNTAADADIPVLGLTYRLVNPPAGMSIDPNGVISWSPTEAQGPSTNVITTVVTDTGSPALSATNSFVVVVNELNRAPVLPVQGERVLTGLEVLVVTNTATDADLPANPLAYQLANAPTNATIGSDGVIRWTPSVTQVPSTNLFTTVVTDSNPWAINAQHLSATNTFKVVVNAIHKGPSLPGQTNVTLRELTLLTVTNTAVSTDVPPLKLTYSLVNPPAGASIDTNGVITWTPSEAQGPSTNTLTTIVTDAGTPALSATNSFTVVVQEVNTAPVLPALTTVDTLATQQVVIVSTATDSDIPANPLTYQLVAGPSRASIDANGVITWTPELTQVPGTYVFTTVVTDSNPWAINQQHLSTTNSFTVVVNPIHNGPALPGQPQVVINEASLLVVANTAEDTDIPALNISYRLLNPPDGATIDFSGYISWTPSEAQGPGTYTLTTVASDDGVPPLSTTNSFQVVVNEINTAPVLPVQVGRTLGGTEKLQVTNTATDRDLPANALTYQLLAAPAGATIDTNGLITWTPTLTQVPSTNLFRTLVTDYSPQAINAKRLSASNSFTVVVNMIHNGPVLPLQTNLTVAESTTLVVTNTAAYTDVPASALSYRLALAPSGATIDTNGVITWTPSEAQGPSTNLFTTVVQDSGSPVLSSTNTFTVVVNEINLPPVLSAQPDRTLAGRQPLLVTNAATDADLPVNSLAYQLINSPAGAAIDANGVIWWTPSVAQVPSTNVFTTVVTDSNPWAITAQHLSATNSFTVTVNAVHNGPTLPVQTNLAIAELTTLTLTNTAFDADLPVLGLTYTLLKAPAGMTISTNGIITWATSESNGPSTNVVTTVVVDNGVPPLSDTNTFMLVVNEVNTPPVLPSQPGHQLVAGFDSLTVTNTASDSDVPVNSLQYQLVNPPSGAAIDANGVITWTPSLAQAPSTNTFTTVVTDSNPWAVNAQQLSATNSFSVVVISPIHNGPVLPVQTNRSVAELGTLVVTNTASSADIPVLGLSYSLLNAPMGLTISTNGVITWSPTEAQGPSTNVITTVVTDTGSPALSATNSFVVVVNELNRAPVLPVQGDRVLTGQEVLVVTNAATDADLPANPLAYQLANAPTNATIGSDGVIRWTPSLTQVPSTNLFTTVVTDANPWAINAQHLSATNSFTVVVNAIHKGPSLPGQTNVTLRELTLLTVTNTAVSTDVPPLKLTYSLVNPPAGASIDTNGVIAWTPSEAQGPSTNTLTTIVTDAGTPALSATNSFTVVVQEVNTAPVLPLQLTVNASGTLPVMVTNRATDGDLPANTLEYQLVAGPTGASIDTNGVITWTPAADQMPSTNTFTTVVTDFNPWAVNAQHLSATNSFSVVVNPIHNGPTLPNQTNRVIAELSTLMVTNTAIDTDSPALGLNYTLLEGPTNAVINTNGVITWSPTEAQGPSTNTFRTLVWDNGWPSLSATNIFQVVVQELNTAPVLPQQGTVDLALIQPMVVTNTATDADLPANTLAYQLVASPQGASINANGVITWTPTLSQVPSTNVFTTVVTDSNPWAVNAQHLSTTNSFTVVVHALAPERLLPWQTNVALAELTLLTVTNTATQGGVPVVGMAYQLLEPPQGMKIDTNGVITWMPTEAQGPSTNLVTTVVFDPAVPELSETNSFTVFVQEINSAPVLPPQPDWTLMGQQALTITNTATDADLPANDLTYQLVAPPNGATIDSNGVITWTPTLDQVPSTNLITTVVTDFNPWAVNAQRLSATNTFKVVLTAIHVDPVLPVQPDRTVAEGVTLTVTNTASSADVPALALSYSLLVAPSGATIDNHGIISWTPSEAQGASTNTFTTIVYDNGVPTLSAMNTFTVVVNEMNTPPVLPAQPDRVLVGTQTLVLTNTATDADLPANTLTYQFLAAPAGALLTTDGVITWTPAAAQVPSTNLFMVKVTDSNPLAVNAQHLSATNSFKVVVTTPAVQFQVTSLRVANGVAVITWNSVAGQTYRLQYKNALTDSNWQDAPPDVTANGTQTSVTNAPGVSTQRFYRILALP